MAEAVMHQTLRRYPELHRFLDVVDSAAIAADKHLGRQPLCGTTATLERHNISYSHAGRDIEPEDFFKFTHILCMEREHIDKLIVMRDDASHRLRADPRQWAEIALFGAFGHKPLTRPRCKSHKKYGHWLPEEIVDTKYFPTKYCDDMFEITYRQCKQYAQGFVEQELMPLATRWRS